MEQFARSREGLSFFAKFRQLVELFETFVTEMKRMNDLKERELQIKEDSAK